MYDNGNNQERAFGLKELEAIHDGLACLAELSMRLNDYEMAQKLKDAIALAEERIEHLRAAGARHLALS